jgi:hypothetical protein
MVGPPGSTSDGAFSCTGLDDEEEVFWESLLEDEDCAEAGNAQKRERAATVEMTAR